MTDPSAIQVALLIRAHPAYVRDVRNLPLPAGVTDLLRVAIGEDAALDEFSRTLERSPGDLRRAAAFFVEQVMLTSPQDSYRVLGTRADASYAELRQNMALLMRWLHPDVLQDGASDAAAIRGIFANRVSQAWEDLKSADRRAAYDRSLTSAASANPVPGLGTRPDGKWRRRKRASSRAIVRAGVMRWPQTQWRILLQHTLALLRGRR